MDLRKLQTREPTEPQETEEEKPIPEKPKRTRKRSKPEKEKSPLAGFLAVALLIIIGVMFLYSTTSDSFEPKVKGVSSQVEKNEKLSKEASQAAGAIRGRFEDRLDSIKERVEGLNSEDVIENSPQVEKIIKDLESLQGLPQREVRKACEAICEAL